MTTQIDLSDFFITKSQAEDFKSRLDNIIDKLYSTNFNFEKTLLEEFGIEKKDKFITLLRENKINDLTNTTIQDFLKNVQDTISNIPVMTLTIAFEPNQEILKSLSQWFLFNLNKQIVFDFQIDKKIIAGAAINYDGKFKDYSIKSTFDEIIKKELEKPIPIKSILHQKTEFMTIGR